MRSVRSREREPAEGAGKARTAKPGSLAALPGAASAARPGRRTRAAGMAAAAGCHGFGSNRHCGLNRPDMPLPSANRRMGYSSVVSFWPLASSPARSLDVKKAATTGGAGGEGGWAAAGWGWQNAGMQSLGCTARRVQPDQAGRVQAGCRQGRVAGCRAAHTACISVRGSAAAAGLRGPPHSLLL